MEHDGPWPDGPLPVPLDGSTLLEAAGATGVLDVRSFRLCEVNQFGWRDAEHLRAVQFEPAADYHAEYRPVGILWLRLWRYTWETASFPRKFRLYFDTVRGSDQHLLASLPAGLQIQPLISYDIAGQKVSWHGAEGSPLLEWNASDEIRPHLHPVTSPDGRVLTADVPRDHIWHHGLMLGWTDVESPGRGTEPYIFWGEPNAGQLRPHQPRDWQHGPVWSGFRQQVDWCSRDGRQIFSSDVGLRYSKIEKVYDWIDIDLKISAGPSPVEFKSEYGHLTFRMNLAFQDGALVTPEGRLHDVDMIAAKAVPWIGFDGLLDGRPAGVLLLNDPGNPCGLPSGDGSCTLRDFILDQGDLFAWLGMNPFRLQPQLLQPGESLSFRYRLVLTNRKLDEALVNLMVRGVTTSPVVTWAIE